MGRHAWLRTQGRAPAHWLEDGSSLALLVLCGIGVLGALLGLLDSVGVQAPADVAELAWEALEEREYAELSPDFERRAGRAGLLRYELLED